MQSWFSVTKSSLSSSSPRRRQRQKQSSTYVAAIVDDFKWWHKNREANTAGKLFLVDEGKSSKFDRKVIEIFFDDNIERDHAHIVDTRYADSHSPLSFTEANKKYLRRVEPARAILDINYFINEVKNSIQLHLNTIKN